MATHLTLALYQYDGCPFCIRVRGVAERLNVELELRDTIAESDAAIELIEATGRRSVPVLRIEDASGQVRWLPESADIIAYLHDRFGTELPPG